MNKNFRKDLLKKFLNEETYNKIDLLTKSMRYEERNLFTRAKEYEEELEICDLLERLSECLEVLEDDIEILQNTEYRVVYHETNKDENFKGLLIDNYLLDRIIAIDSENEKINLSEKLIIRTSELYAKEQEIEIFLGDGYKYNEIYFDKIRASFAACDEVKASLEEDSQMNLFEQENIEQVQPQEKQENVKELLKSYVKDETIEILDDKKASELYNTINRINDLITQISEEKTSKLDRLKQERAAALESWASYSVKTAGGQPMNDKKNNQSFYNGLERIENRIRSLDAQIEKQEQIEARKLDKKAGLNKNGGLILTVDNIDRIRLEIEKAAQGQSIYSAATIRKYKKALKDLETQLESTENNHNEKLDELINSGKLNQWKKQPSIYFIKGYKKLAIKMLDNGSFIIAKKFAPKDDKEKAAIESILNQLAA